LSSEQKFPEFLFSYRFPFDLTLSPLGLHGFPNGAKAQLNITNMEKEEES
jgi:hypothetical protein